MTHTNNIPPPEKRYTLAEMSDVMMRRDAPAYGFFVSQALWDSISNRIKHEEGVGLGTAASIALHGVQIAVDPSLPDTEFDVAFTADAWSKRLSAIRPTHQSGTPER